MLERAVAALKIDLRRSFLIGDRWRDVDCANAAGCRAIFISRNYAETLRTKPEATVGNFSEAVAFILDQTGAEISAN